MSDPRGPERKILSKKLNLDLIMTKRHFLILESQTALYDFNRLGGVMRVTHLVKSVWLLWYFELTRKALQIIRFGGKK